MWVCGNSKNGCLQKNFRFFLSSKNHMSIAEGKKPGYFYTRLDFYWLLLLRTFRTRIVVWIDHKKRAIKKKEVLRQKEKKKRNNKKRNTKKIKAEILFVLDSILLLSQETPKTMLNENVHKIYIFKFKPSKM